MRCAADPVRRWHAGARGQWRDLQPSWTRAVAAWWLRLPERLRLRGDHRAVCAGRRSRRQLDRLNGIFAFALWDEARGRAMIARDPTGVCTLYWGHDGAGRLGVA